MTLPRHFAIVEGIAGRRAREETVEALLRQVTLGEVTPGTAVLRAGGLIADDSSVLL